MERLRPSSIRSARIFAGGANVLHFREDAPELRYDRSEQRILGHRAVQSRLFATIDATTPIPVSIHVPGSGIGNV
jgi:hypothetical protein